MTNKEKRDYLSLLLANISMPYSTEISRIRAYVPMLPTSLYKFRKFDEYSFDMIKNNYVYLSQAGSLDDPYDCLNFIDFDVVFNKETFKFSPKIISYIVDIICAHREFENIDKEKTIQMLVSSIEDNKVNKDTIDNCLFLNKYQRHVLKNIMINYLNRINEILSNDSLNGLLTNINQAHEKIGVCSLTTKRDNKPMWSLYADRYKGYCIEYEINLKREIMSNLCPVIYTNSNDDIIKTIVEYAIELSIRFFSSFQMKSDISSFARLTCTKDTDWEYQDEWRLVGKANSKETFLKIKNIYLGYDVTKENEEKVLGYAFNECFGVYKMDKPINSKQITYFELTPNKE